MGFGAFISLGLAKVAGVVTPVKVTKRKRHIRDEEGKKGKSHQARQEIVTWGTAYFFE